MKVIVQKYGGSSVADLDRIRLVADHVVRTRREGHNVVVVVSAMGNTTDELLRLAYNVSSRPNARELDMLQSAGERISMSLLTMAICDRGVPATSFTGSQAGIITDMVHGKAKITAIKADRVRRALGDGQVVVIAGFQGVSTGREVTTLGRGGSDTSAVAIAAALGCDTCEIYTDVAGVYTADPRVTPSASLLRTLSYEEMLEIAATGGRVLALRSVEFARRYGIVVHVRSSFTWEPGTRVEALPQSRWRSVSSVTHDMSEAIVSIIGLPDRPGIAARLLGSLANEAISIDMILQSSPARGAATISFTIPKADLMTGLTVTEGLADEVGAQGVTYDDDIGRVSVIGSGMRTRAGVAAEIFETLAKGQMNPKMTCTSEIRTSCILPASEVEPAVRHLHDALGLDGGHTVHTRPPRTLLEVGRP